MPAENDHWQLLEEAVKPYTVTFSGVGVLGVATLIGVPIMQ